MWVAPGARYARCLAGAGWWRRWGACRHHPWPKASSRSEQESLDATSRLSGQSVRITVQQAHTLGQRDDRSLSMSSACERTSTFR
jgi:hypothetical protein